MDTDRRYVSQDISGLAVPLGYEVTLHKGSWVQVARKTARGLIVETPSGDLLELSPNVGTLLLDKAPEVAEAASPPATQASERVSIPTDKETGVKVDERLVWEALRQCYDPELPVNIVDLGLIYRCALHLRDNGSTRISIVMTLTAPGCSMSEDIVEDVRGRILAIDGVEHVDVDIVFDPPWDASKLSEAAKLELGML